LSKVLIKKFEDNSTVKVIECNNLRSAELVEKGLNINLNHDEYYTEIEE
jgi:hypothetical protein